MTNQRPAKAHRAAMPGEGQITPARLREFADEATRLLTESGEEDAAFYFEQLAEFIRRHPEKGLNESVGRILGL
jgi:hypothetical protein